MNKGAGPYKQRPGRGDMPKTGANKQMAPLMSNLGAHQDHDTDPPSRKYERVVNPDTGGERMRMTDLKGNTTSFTRPSNEQINSAREQQNNLSNVSSFSQKHTRGEDGNILVDGKPRTNFSGNTGYNMDSGNLQSYMRKRGIDPKYVNQNVIKQTHKDVYDKMQQAFDLDTEQQAVRNRSVNNLVNTTAGFSLRGANMYKK